MKPKRINEDLIQATYPTIPTRACSNCKNYHPLKEYYGECHAHPPVVIGEARRDNGEVRLRGVWPQMEPTEWCGEFRGKEC